MAKYIVKNTTILHNKKTYGVGEEIELTDKIQIAKLADYLTPVETIPESNSGDASTPKTTKSNKKTEKATATTDSTTGTTADASTVEVKTEVTKEEAQNGTEAIQTPTN